MVWRQFPAHPQQPPDILKHTQSAVICTVGAPKFSIYANSDK